MRTHMNRGPALLAGLALAAAAATAGAQQNPPPSPQQQKDQQQQQQTAQSLDQLLEQTKNSRLREAQANQQREARFMQERNRQAELLGEAKRELANQEARSKSLSAQFDANEKKLTEMQAVLDAKGGNLGELFGVVRQVSGDVSSMLYGSLITAQYPKRDEPIAELAQSKALPSIEKLEKLWYEMQREMTETGKVLRFKTKVVQPDGKTEDEEVLRVGRFVAITGKKYLTYLPSVGTLAVLARQPVSPYPGLADDFFDETKGYEKMVIDPSSGVLLSLFGQRPSWLERINQGAEIGYLIILVGLAGLVLFVRQFIFLLGVNSSVNRQLQDINRPSTDNPLGRVLTAFKGDTSKVEEHPEVVELRISEAVLREVPPLERYQSFLRLAVAAGPLMGLIGTVIGMIKTFQTITESGGGDPKLMATGIGLAMIATALGLGIAIPLLFANAALQTISKKIVQILDEQSTGLLAERIEKQTQPRRA